MAVLFGAGNHLLSLATDHATGGMPGMRQRKSAAQGSTDGSEVPAREPSGKARRTYGTNSTSVQSFGFRRQVAWSAGRQAVQVVLSSPESCSRTERRLTLPSSGLAPAAQAWPSFHSGPSPRRLREPLMSNVRRHKREKLSQVERLGSILNPAKVSRVG